MAARKTAAGKAAAAVGTVSQDTSGGVPGLDPELERIRDEARAAEPQVKETPPGDPDIDPALVEARTKALEAEKNRKTF